MSKEAEYTFFDKEMEKRVFQNVLKIKYDKTGGNEGKLFKYGGPRIENLL